MAMANAKKMRAAEPSSGWAMNGSACLRRKNRPVAGSLTTKVASSAAPCGLTRRSLRSFGCSSVSPRSRPGLLKGERPRSHWWPFPALRTSHTPAGTLKEGSLEEVIGVDVVAVGIHVVAVDIDVVLVGVNARQVQTHARRDPLLQLLDLQLESHYSPPFV